MQKHGYKILGVLILIYSFVVGMIVPLTPGIVEASPQRAKAGDSIQIEITGYNSSYRKGEGSMKAWIKLDSLHTIQANQILVKDDRHATLTFNLPFYLPTSNKVADGTLIIDNAIDGTSVLPSALFITQDDIDVSEGSRLWQSTTISNLSERSFMTFPFRNILQETIRNTYFHVSLWFAMIFLLGAAVWNAVAYLRKGSELSDNKSASFTQVGLLFGILGLVTGAIWAEFTWGAFWSWDVKQNTTAIALLIYLAYFVLRNSFDDQERKARISSVYSIFAFVSLIILIYIIPRMTDSLHPGNGGNPAFGGEDLDNTMRMVFYPAIIGWTLVGVWIANLVIRAERLNTHFLELE